ncbi:putative vacuolar fusion protein Mon1 [Lupinus albus]|uniref:Vacuolar fusion protein MON1 homolog n=1 Tax=Lupinus albus TaxID=3870 RepID=A0A6A4NDT3_LUPAL|nr:putative vacuolar fusion protein Mon1 [Lupinus albus]
MMLPFHAGKGRSIFFVLSHSCKPIYSRYGDEHKLAGFSPTLQAIISFVENGYCGFLSFIVVPDLTHPQRNEKQMMKTKNGWETTLTTVHRFIFYHLYFHFTFHEVDVLFYYFYFLILKSLFSFF